MEETRVSRCFLLSLNVALIKNRCALNADGRNRTVPLGYSALPFISIIQKCLHFCITITACDKKCYAITKEELSSPIIVKFAVIKLRGGFEPHFCHTRPVVCPSWTSASSATRKHCNCEYRELPPQVLDHSRILGI